MHNLPIQIMAVAFVGALAYLVYFRALRPFLKKLWAALVPMEDQWTWTTRDGAVFEDVEVECIKGDEVIFQHKFGKACVPIALLSKSSRLKLYRGYQSANRSGIKAEESRASGVEADKKEKVPGNRPIAK